MNDVAITLDAGANMSFEDIKLIKKITVKGADHFVQMSAPAKVNESIREFLS